MAIKRKTGVCSKCPPGSKPTILTKGMCTSHYWADRLNTNGKKFARNTLDNPILQIPDIQDDVGSGFTGFIPSVMGVRGMDTRCPDQQILKTEPEEVEGSKGQTGNDPTPNRNSEQAINQPFLNLINARNSIKNPNYNPNLEGADFQTLNDWYVYHVLHCDWTCENCNAPIIAVSDAEKYSCQAHILPKEHFPSVALNKLNHLLLAGFMSKCGCHYKYDFSWQKAEKMPVFELAISRFFLFKKHLSVSEINRLPKPFVEYL